MTKVVDHSDGELNKRIHEIMGLCWHEWKEGLVERESKYCLKCKTKNPNEIDFMTWEGFRILYTWILSRGVEVFGRFITLHNEHPLGSKFECIDIKYISPRTLAKSTVEFFNKNQCQNGGEHV